LVNASPPNGTFVPALSTANASGTAVVNGTLAAFNQNGELFSAPGVPNQVTPSQLFSSAPYADLQQPSDRITLAAGTKMQLNDRAQFYTDTMFVRDDVATP